MFSTNSSTAKSSDGPNISGIGDPRSREFLKNGGRSDEILATATVVQYTVTMLSAIVITPGLVVS